MGTCTKPEFVSYSGWDAFSSISVAFRQRVPRTTVFFCEALIGSMQKPAGAHARDWKKLVMR
jgi:hypothetical protein